MHFSSFHSLSKSFSSDCPLLLVVLGCFSMTSLRRTKIPLFLVCHTHYGFRLCSSAAKISRSWDPTVSLRLEHPTLILLEKCRNSDHFKQILAQMMRLHLVTQTFPMSRLLYFSAVSHPWHLNEAVLLFKHFTPHPNLYIYNIMISALSFSSSQSLNLYKSMLSSCIFPDEHSLLSLLKSSRNISERKQTHGHVIINGFSSHVYLQNSLMKMYLETGEVALAQQVFHCMLNRDIVSLNIMIAGYARNGYSMEALKLLHDMTVSGIEPDQYTIVGLLLSCGQLRDAHLGKSVHGLIVRRMPFGGWGLILNNALLDMYAKCGEMKTAMKVFDGIDERDDTSWNIIIGGFANAGELNIAYRLFCETPFRNLISWNSILAGYARMGDFRTAMKLCREMFACKIRPDKMTAIALISAAAEMGVLHNGKCVHGWIVKAHGTLDAFLGSALIDMYCKCGIIERSYIVFEMVYERDVTIWTTMITGLALHGHGIKALELFWKMLEEGVMPNAVTLVAVLTACSHAGLVDQGYKIFESMKQSYNIEPGVEHYGCLVDLLARSGKLTEAINVIKGMPMKPTRSIWGAILSASKVHQNMEIAEAVSGKLLEVEPEEEGGYILLSNTYAACGKWKYSDKIRKAMDSRGVKKIAGYSRVIIDGVLNEFISSDKRHPRWAEIYCMLCDLNRVLMAGAEVSFQCLQQMQGLDME
ncbi:pentatricopeptide repeat-containing protein At3g04750, mitochondrial [Phoenix dactylifera]|uniref:Pentatricopeptide repeat-containing protein At3g04750, mitochondrial n=1 Tax=Phoenix dactylifera TaxID=42345 RepID=A0A8B9ADT9_PHODC|nr:pentatricopeptide repeat-containing protein At3g04750, mitochondrial [Phoenix dactylifera]XP_038984876.1 pentatricopeptide repeat-containing protein At3g04750, mitochondrial [Phoenix dactylifera]